MPSPISCSILRPTGNGACGGMQNGCTAGDLNNSDTADDNSTHYLWQCLGINGGTNDLTCNLIKPVNGACGGTQNGCTGTLNDVADNSTHYLWQCNGLHGGTNDLTCNLIIPINGACDNTQNNGCSAGNSDDAINDNSTHYKWTCRGQHGGTDDATCNFLIPPGTNINGACDNARQNGCSAGTLNNSDTDDDNSTHYLWQCIGKGTGTSVTTCNLLMPPVPEDEDSNVDDDDDDAGSGRRTTFQGFIRGKTASASGRVSPGASFEYDLRSKGLSVRGIRMTLNETASNAVLTVSDLKRRSTTEKPQGDVHGYFGTHLSRAAERSLEKFTVTFAVNKSWLQATGFEKDEVVLMAREGDGWKELNTEPEAEGPTEIEFSADARRPSVFAVTGRKKDVKKVVIVPEVEEVKEAEENYSPPAAEEAKGGNWAWLWWILGGIVILAVFLALLRWINHLRDEDAK